jgi:hypothetical protein
VSLRCGFWVIDAVWACSLVTLLSGHAPHCGSVSASDTRACMWVCAHACGGPLGSGVPWRHLLFGTQLHTPYMMARSRSQGQRKQLRHSWVHAAALQQGSCADLVSLPSGLALTYSIGLFESRHAGTVAPLCELKR